MSRARPVGIHSPKTLDSQGPLMATKPYGLEESSRPANQRHRFGFRLTRIPNLPVSLFSPKSKKTHTVTSVLNDAIRISSPDLCNTDYCLNDDKSSVVTIATTPVKKSVNFDLLQTEEFGTNPPYILDDETIATLWYSEDERMSMKFNRDNALDSGLEKKEWIDGMNTLIHYCNQAIPQSTYDPEDLKGKAKALVPTYRGLESHGLTQLTALRRKHMNSVLEHIERIPKKIPKDLRDRMVSARSLQYSRPLTLLALVLAQADAQEARIPSERVVLCKTVSKSKKHFGASHQSNET
ncbi:hypothetical protein IV203_020740 [Nitzschia inconspicua]|uniref:Uncharacterized protein n=1 Tax=Nitzschia inconspicua TaxID=303405 RepID=A0A9K3KGL3_9STRA|nr:hypothetical protein IV203_021568 [Nitzschia inconspicua]KAG7342796.1 hypothetical protein IV203_020740 [Nitzschia inconspicua]